MTAQFKSTPTAVGPVLFLCPIIFLQFLLCACRWHHDDLLGLAKDGVVVTAGAVTVYKGNPTAALLYAFMCFSGFFYDALVSVQWWTWWMNTRISYANIRGVGALLEIFLVASAPIVSAVGAVLAGRIYFLSKAGSHAELHPLVGSATGATYGKDSYGRSDAASSSGLSLPAALAPHPPPLSGCDAKPMRSPPFRAIFGTPLPVSTRAALAERTPDFNTEEVGAVL